jgi:hypothetical protein
LAGLAGQWAGQQIGLDQNLKAIADSNDRFARGDEIKQAIAQMLRDLVGEDSASGNVVAITKPAGDGQGLVVAQLGGGFEQAIDMQSLGVEAGLFKCKSGFAIAIGSGGAEDQGAGSHVREFMWESEGGKPAGQIRSPKFEIRSANSNE